MKSFRVIVIAASMFAAAVFAASADNVSVEIGGTGWLFNSLGGFQSVPGITVSGTKGTFTSPSETIQNEAMPSFDPYVNGYYNLKVGDGLDLHFGARLDEIAGLAAPSSVSILRQEPFVDLTYGNLSARVSFPLYEFGYDYANDPTYYEVWKTLLNAYYKGIYLGTDFTAYAPTDLITNYDSVAYKYWIDKTHAVALSATTEIGLSPAWLYDVKPQISFTMGPVQLDIRESIYFSDQTFASGASTPSTSDTLYNTEYFTDPKLTVDFSSLGLKGFKAWLAPSIFTYVDYPNGANGDVNGFFGNTINPNNSSKQVVGSSVTQAFSYTSGPYYLESGIKYHNFDETIYNGGGKNPDLDPYVTFSYTMKF